MSGGPGYILTIIGLLVGFALLRVIVGGRTQYGGALRLMLVLLAVALPVLLFTARNGRPETEVRAARAPRAPRASGDAGERAALAQRTGGSRRVPAEEIQRKRTDDEAGELTELESDASRLRYEFAYGLFDLDDALELKDLAARLVQRLASAKLEEHWQELPPVVIEHDDEQIVVIGRGEVRTEADVDEVLPSDDEAARQEWNRVDERAVDSAAERLADHLRQLDASTVRSLRGLDEKLAALPPDAVRAVAARIIRDHAARESDSRARRQRDGGAVLSLTSRFRIGRDALLEVLAGELGVGPGDGSVGHVSHPDDGSDTLAGLQTSDGAPRPVAMTSARPRPEGRATLQGIRSAAIIVLILIGSAAVLRANVRRGVARE